MFRIEAPGCDALRRMPPTFLPPVYLAPPYHFSLARLHDSRYG